MKLHQNSKTKARLRVLAFVIVSPTLLIAFSLWLEQRLGLPRIPWPIGLSLFIIFFVPGVLLARLANVYLKKAGKGTLYPSPETETRKLVTSGPYAHVRNPMVLGSFLMLVSISLFCGSFIALVLGPALWLAIYSLTRRRGEEQALEKRFGEEYRAYKDGVPPLLPRWSSIGPLLKLLVRR
jgi:protein-S-isoprenylcysteine O-methyltransferase Ste14